jgi:hypothetical protein
MDLFEPPSDAHHALAADGEIFVWRVRRDVVIDKVSGTLSLPLATCLTDFFEHILEPGLVFEVFADLERLTRYTHEAREHISHFALQHLAFVGANHFLISSKIVALGLSSFKQDIGGERVRFYTERSSFLQSYYDTLASPLRERGR